MLETALGVSAIVMVVGFAQAQYTTGFESPPFSSGALNGQDTWTSGGAVSVRTASQMATELTASGLTAGTTVHGGDQALLISGFGGSITSRRVISGLETATSVLLDVWARPLSPRLDVSATNVGNMFLVMEDSSNAAAGRTAGFRFGYYDNGSGTVAPHIDYATVGSAIWQDTGLSWDPNSWYQFTIDVDYTARTYDFFVNGTQANTSPIAFYNGSTATSFGAVRVFRGSYQAGMIMDDLAVTAVPEPSVVALLLVGGCALLLRRKR